MAKMCGSHTVMIHFRYYIIELDTVRILLAGASTGRTCLESTLSLEANSADARAMLPAELQLMDTSVRTPTKHSRN